RLLPQLHRVLGKIPCGSVGRSGLLVPEDFRGASNRQTETGRKKPPHYKRRNLLSDSPLLGKPNLAETCPQPLPLPCRQRQSQPQKWLELGLQTAVTTDPQCQRGA